MSYYVYILVSEKDGTLYTGQTSDLRDRLVRHNSGQVHSTKGKGPFRLGCYEEFGSRSEAMWREWELKKKWNAERKTKLVNSFNNEKTMEILGL